MLLFSGFGDSALLEAHIPASQALAEFSCSLEGDEASTRNDLGVGITLELQQLELEFYLCFWLAGCDLCFSFLIWGMALYCLPPREVTG